MLDAVRRVVSSFFAGLFRRRKGTGRIFLVSDLHFNHARIIGYCGRPYRSVTEMNRDLVRRWNSVVGPGDTVYCLGDFCMRGDPRNWIRALNGRKIFIRGNHDQPLLKARHHSVLSCSGQAFYLAHDPADALSRGRGGWSTGTRTTTGWTSTRSSTGRREPSTSRASARRTPPYPWTTSSLSTLNR